MLIYRQTKTLVNNLPEYRTSLAVWQTFNLVVEYEDEHKMPI
jgi:hypothetical protein